MYLWYPSSGAERSTWYLIAFFFFFQLEYFVKDYPRNEKFKEKVWEKSYREWTQQVKITDSKNKIEWDYLLNESRKRFPNSRKPFPSAAVNNSPLTTQFQNASQDRIQNNTSQVRVKSEWHATIGT